MKQEVTTRLAFTVMFDASLMLLMRAGHGLLSFAFYQFGNICPYVHLGRANFQRHMEDDRISENPREHFSVCTF